jgi:hypothetical protein
VTQHYAVAAGDHVPVLRHLAKIMDFDFHLV